LLTRCRDKYKIMRLVKGRNRERLVSLLETVVIIIYGFGKTDREIIY